MLPRWKRVPPAHEWPRRAVLQEHRRGDVPALTISKSPAVGAGAAAGGEFDDAAALKAEARRLAAHCAMYRGADTRRAIVQILTTAVPFLALLAAMWATVDDAYWLTVLLALPASGLLVRFFIIQHDCGHGSFLPSAHANDTLGRLISVLTLTPYGLWRRVHAKHHATSGNLDRRGYGDIDTLTLAEYGGCSTWGRLRYRIYRHPLFLFPIAVPFFFVILQRLPWGHPLDSREGWRSVVGLNIAIIVVYGLLGATIGYARLMWIVAPMILMASALGGWLFFIQHQFENAHWDASDEWDFQVAAIRGSSYYDLPKPLEWFTGSIGLHHIHHLNSVIPNYRLRECLAASPEFQTMNRVTLCQSFKCARLAVWDEAQRRLITFREAHTAMAEQAAGLRPSAPS
ncbi:MAG: fatty acid desaturase [Hyphomicrobiaceae bacterium]